MQLTRAFIAVAAIGVAALLVKMPSLTSAPTPPREFPTPLPRLHGIALQLDVSTGLMKRYGEAVREITDIGADAVTLSFNLYQEHAGSDMVGPDEKRTPKPDELRKMIRLCRTNGLRVVLMPKVLLSKPRGREWRGKIKPPSWDAWFDQYRRQLIDIAKIAEAENADVLIVGSELVTTEKFDDRWRRLIGDVRRVFNGRLAYSANWDHYKNIEFWGDLDLIGLTTYNKLADEENPPMSELLESWKKIKNRILVFQAKQNRPILFTEVGWCSQEGAAIEAWNYFRSRQCTPEALEEQENCYEAFIQTWRDEPEVGGVIWWEWTIYPGGPKDTTYTPRGKPAAEVLRRWFAEAHRKSASTKGSASATQAN